MKFFFEDGDLIQSLLSTGFVPYTSQLIFELHMQPSDFSFTVAMLYNWQEIPIPGPCMYQTRCDYYTFQLMVQQMSFVGQDDAY